MCNTIRIGVREVRWQSGDEDPEGWRITVGTQGCRNSGMVDEQGDERRGAQRESPAEREAKKDPANKQDLEKPSEGRDKPPDETVEKGKRSPDSPWMGGG
jgi:hypothetical protein